MPSYAPCSLNIGILYLSQGYFFISYLKFEVFCFIQHHWIIYIGFSRMNLLYYILYYIWMFIYSRNWSTVCFRKFFFFWLETKSKKKNYITLHTLHYYYKTFFFFISVFRELVWKCTNKYSSTKPLCHLNVCVGGLDIEAFSSSSLIFCCTSLSHVSFHCVFKQICGYDTLIHCFEIAAPLSFSRHMSDNQCTCILFECTQHDNSRGEMQIRTNVFSTLHVHLFYSIEHFFSHGAQIHCLNNLIDQSDVSK